MNAGKKESYEFHFFSLVCGKEWPWIPDSLVAISQMLGWQVCAIAQGAFFKEKFISSLKQEQKVWKCSKFLGKHGDNVASFCCVQSQPLTMSPIWPGTYQTEQAGFEHRDLLAQVLRLKEESPHLTIASLVFFFKLYFIHAFWGWSGVGHACHSSHVEVIKQPMKVGVLKSSGLESSTFICWTTIQFTMSHLKG